eukprot:scaffold186848_cov17-Tisochrysis_lutea.AAC.2
MAARCGEVWTHVVTGASRKPQVLMNVCCGLRGFAGGWLHRYWPSRQTARRVWLIVAPADAGCGALLGRGCRGSTSTPQWLFKLIKACPYLLRPHPHCMP